MKKKLFFGGALILISISFVLYFFSFTGTDASNLFLTIYNEDDNGWKITGSENDGGETPISSLQAIDYPGTVYLRRTVTEDWASYNRVKVDSGRAVLVFIDDSLVFSNHQTALSKPAELPLMQMPQGQPFTLEFSIHPSWVGKTVTVVTRLYENEPCGSISFHLVNDNVNLFQHEAWVNQQMLPGAVFGVLSLLLIGLFLFELFTRKKGYPLLFLALASLLQMLCYMSVLNGYPLPMIDTGLAMVLYFLFPLLYFGTKLTHYQKAYYITILSVWSIYFILYLGTYVFQLLPYWFDKVDILCFIPLGIMLGFCFKEQRQNSFARHFLSLLLMFGTGWGLLFVVTAALKIPLGETIIIIFKEAFNLYCRPLLFWVFTTVLFALFILAVWDLLRERVQAAKQMERLQNDQTLLNLQIEAAKGQLDSLRITQEQAVLYRHDMRHHFSLIKGYLADGEVQRAEEYLAQAREDIDTITPEHYCENETVNLILSAFAGKAKAKGVALSIDVNLPKQLPFVETELCALLSNGLENAVDAASKVENILLRNISFNCRTSENRLLIYIENSYSGTVVLENGLPRSSHEGHGFGTKSMAAIAEKHNGYCSCEADGKTFVLRVVLPL